MITGLGTNSTVFSSFVLILCFLAQKLYTIVRYLHAQKLMCWSCHSTFPWALCVTSVSGNVFSHCTGKWYAWTLGIESSSSPDLLGGAWNFIIIHNNGPWTGYSFSMGSARKVISESCAALCTQRSCEGACIGVISLHRSLVLTGDWQNWVHRCSIHCTGFLSIRALEVQGNKIIQLLQQQEYNWMGNCHTM